MDILDDWKRPVELFPDGSQLMVPDEESDLVQDVTTDCSVVASLCASMRTLMAGNKSVSLKIPNYRP